ncbi:hypothetical protein HF086_011631 [Spodoptera exigua]|uniref:Uncharacterized protein n=1 Tax=Spodoptera exigua TaxID=7107 RepID=A0A922SLH5_SPOEX|nr:hypothetical protein HF086_011631 [Spodoptera exigua]
MLLSTAQLPVLVGKRTRPTQPARTTPSVSTLARTTAMSPTTTSAPPPPSSTPLSPNARPLTPAQQPPPTPQIQLHQCAPPTALSLTPTLQTAAPTSNASTSMEPS